MTIRRLLPVLALGLLLAHGPAAARTAGDPLEPLNRAVFHLNLAAYDYVLAPAARYYRAATTAEERRSVANLVTNLRAPVVMANQLLQGQGQAAKVTLARFAINSTLGLLGLFDPATQWGYPVQPAEDFGQTLAHYGVPSGPYLVLPLVGPCNLRDAVGRAADYLALGSYLDTDGVYAVMGATAVSEAEPTLEADAASRAAALDLYTAARSAYAQSRDDAIRNGAPLDDPAYEELFRE